MLATKDINLADPDIFQTGEAHDLMRRLRQEDPVHWTDGGERFNGFWSLVRYDDILHVSRNPMLFSSVRGIAGPALRPEVLAEMMANDPAAAAQSNGGAASIITMDPPRHVKMRRVVNKGFTPKAVNAMEPQIREITNQILDRIARKGECDFVLDVASQLPLAVICGMMGLREDDWPLMFELTNKVLGSGDPEYQTDIPEEERGTGEAARRTGAGGLMRMFEFFRNELELRRREPGTDMVSILLEAEVDGEKLTEFDMLAFCFLLIVAGNETTRNAISGGLLALAEHPEEKQRLLSNPALIDSAVEEILRWTSPVMHMARTVTADTEIAGTKIKEGDRVLMWYPSANRDEKYFEDPYRFDITRTPNEHIAFGIGEHFCLGSLFAKKELRVMFEELFRRMPDIEVCGPAERLHSSFIGGIKHLPVRFTPTS